MTAHLARLGIFLGIMALGLWGLAVLPGMWGWAAIMVAFLVGGTASMTAFKRLATKQQIKDDLEARLHND